MYPIRHGGLAMSGAGSPSGSIQLTGRSRARVTHTAVASAVSLALSMASARAQEATPPAPRDEPVELQEITVTAQRRTQTVQDIPYNISVIGGEALGEPSADDAADLAKLVPGLLTVDSGPAARGGNNNFTLRGLRTDNPSGADTPNETISPVSTYFGETPVFIPLILRDLDHVEVLKGPQGTLYGSGAEAGTIRFIPNRPDFDRFTADATAGVGSTEHSGSSLNKRVDAVVNLPFTSNFAMRLAAGYEGLAGFIQDVGLAQLNSAGLPVPSVASDPTSGFKLLPPLRNANGSEQSYARASFRWKPADGVDIEAMYLHQKTDVQDCQCTNPNWPGGTQNLSGYTGPTPPYANAAYTIPAGGPYKNTNLLQEPYGNLVDLGSLVASVDVGFATASSTTSFYDSRTNTAMDSTYQWYIPGGTNFLTVYGNYPRPIATIVDGLQDRSWIQEFRLVSNGTHLFDYVVGGYFQHETGVSIFNQYILGLTEYGASVGYPPLPNPQVGDQVVYGDTVTTFTDRAVFGELTWHATSAWQVTGGIRLFSQSFVENSLTNDPKCGTACGNSLGGSSVYNTQSAHRPLFKLNTSYDIDRDTKLYATFSEGFRRGGATGLAVVGPFASEEQYSTYKPDLAKNYEAGIKGDLDHGRFRYVADVFWIDLLNFQFDSYSPSGTPAVYNGSTAKSKGLELQLDAQITSQVTGTFSYTYTDAVVSSSTNIYDLPAFAGAGSGGPVLAPILAVAIPEGTRLPGVPKNVFNLGVDYKMPLSGEWALDYRADGIYRTSAPGAIPGIFLSNWTMPSSKIIDANITLEKGKQWAFELYGTNLTSDTGYTAATGQQGVPVNTFENRVVTRPRTVGVLIHYHFE